MLNAVKKWVVVIVDSYHKSFRATLANFHLGQFSIIMLRNAFLKNVKPKFREYFGLLQNIKTKNTLKTQIAL